MVEGEEVVMLVSFRDSGAPPVLPLLMIDGGVNVNGHNRQRATLDESTPPVTLPQPVTVTNG